MKLVQPFVWKWPFQPSTGRIQKGVKWAIQASTGRIQKGSKWEIQACCTEKKGEKGRRKREWDRELRGAQIALLILDSSFFYNWLYAIQGQIRLKIDFSKSFVGQNRLPFRLIPSKWQSILTNKWLRKIDFESYLTLCVHLMEALWFQLKPSFN